MCLLPSERWFGAQPFMKQCRKSQRPLITETDRQKAFGESQYGYSQGFGFFFFNYYCYAVILEEDISTKY